MIDIDNLLATPGSLTGGRTYKEVLVAARERISNPDCWTQESYARSSEGFTCKPRDPRACRWCMLGSTAYESNVHGIIPPPLMTFLEDVMHWKFGKDKFAGLGSMNDYLSHPHVLDFLDTALDQFPKETP
jgi:hypothetical protein